VAINKEIEMTELEINIALAKAIGWTSTNIADDFSEKGNLWREGLLK
jgi:hypothetical protein